MKAWSIATSNRKGRANKMTTETLNYNELKGIFLQ